MEQIYALYYDDANTRHYFYVGRTERDPKIRLREHRSKVKRGTEDVYQFIRGHLEPKGCDFWGMELLVNEQGDPSEDCEDFWVVLMIRAGHDLKNMKHGDLKKIAQLRGMASSRSEFTTVKEFVRVRADYERSERLKREILAGPASPHRDVKNILEQAKIRYQEQNGAQAERRRKKDARERAKILERDAWLRSLKLFEHPED